MNNSSLINGKRQVWDVIIDDGSEEYAQAWGLDTRLNAAAFSRSLELPAGYTSEIRNRWETVS